MKDDIRERLHQVMVQNARTEHEQRKLCVVKPDDVALGHLHEQISSEAAALAQLGKGPTDMLQALAELQLYGLSAMAAEAHHHATVDALTEKHANAAAELSPVFLIKKNLCVAPVGDMARYNLQRIADRTLQMIQEHKVRKVLLLTGGLSTKDDVATTWQMELRDELETAGVALEVIV